MAALVPFVLSLILWYLNPFLGILFYLASPAMLPGVGDDYTAIIAMFFLSLGFWFIRKHRIEEAEKDE